MACCHCGLAPSVQPAMEVVGVLPARLGLGPIALGLPFGLTSRRKSGRGFGFGPVGLQAEVLRALPVGPPGPVS